MVTDLTTGNVTSQLLKFAIPLFASNALQAIYNIVDMVVVGQVMGGTGMSAVSVGGEVLHFLTFLVMGFSNAGQVIIARNVGAGNMDEVKRTIGNLFSFLLSAAVIMSIFCLLIRGSILGWLNTPAEAYDQTMDYTVICLIGLPFIYGYNIVSAVLRGMGDGKRPFYFVAAAAILNIILDILFVAGMNMEAFGAALATIIGQGVSFIASLVYLYRKRENFAFDFKLKSFAFVPDTLKRLVSLGVPMAFQFAAISFSRILLTSWINLSGVVMSAVGGVFNKIVNVQNTSAQAFNMAGSAMVGQNLGAKKYDRVPMIMKSVFACGCVISIVMSLIMIFGRDFLIGLFTSDIEVITAAEVITVPAVLAFFSSATRCCAMALINGSGHSRLNLVLAVTDGLVTRIGIAALFGFAFGMGALGFWLGDAIAGYMPFVVAMVFYFSGKWKDQTAL